MSGISSGSGAALGDAALGGESLGGGASGDFDAEESEGAVFEAAAAAAAASRFRSEPGLASLPQPEAIKTAITAGVT